MLVLAPALPLIEPAVLPAVPEAEVLGETVAEEVLGVLVAVVDPDPLTVPVAEVVPVGVLVVVVVLVVALGLALLGFVAPEGDNSDVVAVVQSPVSFTR